MLTDDKDIIRLYFERSEDAIKHTQQKYSRLCRSIAGKILDDEQEVEECLNDVFLGVWNSVPPEEPQNFRAYICRITRNLALKRVRFNTRHKRANEYSVSLDELEEVIPDLKINSDDGELRELLNKFLCSLKHEMRVIFLKRYWFFESVKDISAQFGYSENKVSGILPRAKKKLREFLMKEGYDL